MTTDSWLASLTLALWLAAMVYGFGFIAQFI